MAFRFVDRRLRISLCLLHRSRVSTASSDTSVYRDGLQLSRGYFSVPSRFLCHHYFSLPGSVLIVKRCRRFLLGSEMRRSAWGGAKAKGPNGLSPLQIALLGHRRGLTPRCGRCKMRGSGREWLLLRVAASSPYASTVVRNI